MAGATRRVEAWAEAGGQPPVYAWKYNMAAHYALRHVGQELPPKYAIGPQKKKAMDSRASNLKR